VRKKKGGKVRIRDYQRGSGSPKFEAKIIKELSPPIQTQIVKEREYKFEGSRYKQFKNTLIKEIAKLIKKEVQEKYPFLKVSVSTKHFSGGQEINAKITKYPYHFLEKTVIYPEMRNLPIEKIPSYAFGWAYDPKAKAIIDDIKHIENSYNFDDSDGQSDYYNTRFYADADFDFDLFQAEERRIGLIK
jgi:hypothetical protein